jgi:hypothetical protein
MDASKLKEILDQHKLWIETNGAEGKRANLEGGNLSGADLYRADLYRADLYRADLTGADLTGASLEGADLRGANLERANLKRANLMGANLTGAYLGGANLVGAILSGANLTNAILSDVSWIIPGCLAQLNQISYSFYLKKENKHENFIQDSLGFFIQNNPEEGTFDMLVEDRIIRDIPDWVKYSGMSKIKD